MIKLLASNHRPLNTQHNSFYNTFYALLDDAVKLRVGVGYITTDSLAELLQLVSVNMKPHIELVIGMHYAQGFEPSQLKIAKKLHNFLTENKMGGVYVSTQFAYHGKIYSFVDENGNAFANILGSNNLGSIVKSTSRIYESAVCIKDEPVVNDADQFLKELIKYCTPVVDAASPIKNVPPPLDNLEDVNPVDPDILREYKESAISLFEIPLKADPVEHGKSNLNVFFGKGRENKMTRLVLPRPWYEVELIVPSKITSQPGYPEKNRNNGKFSVVTDDGWQFNCTVSGDYSKNLRSEGSLSILGRWIKGRLENAGVLIPGEIITDDTLEAYGRHSIGMKKINDDLWLLDFDKEQLKK